MDYVKFANHMFYFQWVKKQTREVIEKIRLNRLRDIVAFAYKNSPFYKKIYQDAGINYDDIPLIHPKDLPSTNKKMLMENFDEVVTDSRLKHQEILQQLGENKAKKLKCFERYEILQTSGTSGLMGVFPVEISDLSITAAAVNSFLFSAIHYILHHWKRCKLMNCVVVGPRAGTVLSFYSANKLMLDKHIVSILDPMNEILEKLDEVKPDLLSGYSSTMKSIATEQLKGTINISPGTIICSGDGVNENTRQLIKEAFGVTPIDYYSSTENLFMGFRKDKEYFSVLDPLCLIEENFVTNLYSKIFPIIKYQTDDVIEYIDDYSESPFTKIKLNSQRANNDIKVMDNYGKMIALNSCIMCSLHVEGLYAYQICKQEGNALLVKVSGQKPGLEEKVKNAVLDLLKVQEVEKAVNLKIEYFEKIPPDPKSGKFKVMIP